MKPPSDDHVPVRSEEELKPGLTVWAFDDSPRFKPRWYALVLVRPIVAAFCRVCGPNCPGWDVINAPPGSKGLCHRQCIAQGRLFRLRDLDDQQEQVTSKRRDREVTA